jgi:hypothetical protein
MKIIQFIKRVLLSRLGLVLICLNIFLYIYSWYTRDTSMPFDLRYESWSLIIPSVLNSPLYLLVIGIFFIITSILIHLIGFSTPLDFGVFNWVIGFFVCTAFFILFSLYWSLIGYIIEKIIKKLIAARNNKPL